MQFTIAAILAMAMAVSASPLEVRQSGPTGPIPAGTVYVYNYQSTTGDGGCRPSDFKGLYATITEDDTGACHNITLPAGTTSNDIEANVNRPIRFYNKPCGSLGGSQTITLGPGQQPNGCFNFNIASFQFV